MLYPLPPADSVLIGPGTQDTGGIWIGRAFPDRRGGGMGDPVDEVKGGTPHRPEKQIFLFHVWDPPIQEPECNDAGLLEEDGAPRQAHL